MTHPFATDADLELAFAGVESLLPPGHTGFHQQRAQAMSILLADLATRWHREAAARRGRDWRARPLDPVRLDPAQLRRACVLKTLELLFDAARGVHPEADGFERNALRHREDYESELRRLLELGVAYDWNGDATRESPPAPSPARKLARR